MTLFLLGAPLAHTIKVASSFGGGFLPSTFCQFGHQLQLGAGGAEIKGRTVRLIRPIREGDVGGPVQPFSDLSHPHGSSGQLKTVQLLQGTSGALSLCKLGGRVWGGGDTQSICIFTEKHPPTHTHTREGDYTYCDKTVALGLSGILVTHQHNAIDLNMGTGGREDL